MVSIILLLITLLLYSVLYSQFLFYYIAMSAVQKNLDAEPYILVRNQINRNISGKLTFFYYGSLLCCLALAGVHIARPGSIGFITSAIALVSVMTDMVLVLKGNKPVNNAIQTWTAENYPADWKEYRSRWFFYFQCRQITGLTGFGSLLLQAVLF